MRSALTFTNERPFEAEFFVSATWRQVLDPRSSASVGRVRRSFGVCRTWAEAPPASDTRSEDFAKIVSRCWEPYGARDSDLLHEPIEGCTEEDLGWMMVDYTDAVVFYHLLRDRNSWYIVYKPPPNVAGA